MSGMGIGFLAAGLGGMASFLSPCVLPLVPAYLCYVGGVSLDRLTETGAAEQPEWRRQVLAGAAAFVLGFSTVFVALGASALAVSRLLVGQLDILSQIAGVVIMLFGLHMMGWLPFKWLNRELRFSPEMRGRGLLGAYVIGLAFAFGWTPCIGPVLGAILALAAGEETVFNGMGLLAVYSLGLGVPFLLAAWGMRPFLRFMQRFRHHMHKMELLTGGGLVLTGVLIFSGSLQQLSYLLLEWIPALAKIG
jgi:cytochrome c-type biogenesis protein